MSSVNLAPVLTITANPAIDLNLIIGDDDSSGDFLRAREARRAAGGKGVNVSRVLAELGVASTAACLLGGPDAMVYLSLLEKSPFDVRPIEVEGPTRTNVTFTILVEKTTPESGRFVQLKVNQPGPAFSARAWRAAEAQIRPLLAGRKWVVISGSLPPGAPPDAYARLVRAAHRAGAKVALDCDGAPLRAALAARPDLIKPNREELAHTLGAMHEEAVGGARERGGENAGGGKGGKGGDGGRRRSRAGLIDGAHRLRELGAGAVVVSQGKGECLAIGAAGQWLARPPKIDVGSPMGAGDSLVAGLVAGLLRGERLEDALRLGVACGAACAAAPDTILARQPLIGRLLSQVDIRPLSIPRPPRPR